MSLPLLGLSVYLVELESISSDTLLYLRQVEVIRYLAFDVVGFILAYAGFFIYAIIYFKSHQVLSYTIIGSIILFIANVPCL